MEGMHLVIWIAGIPYAILGNWCLVEDWASVRTAEPFDPICNFRRRKFMRREVVLYRCLHSIMDLASSFNQALIALHITIKLLCIISASQ